MEKRAVLWCRSAVENKRKYVKISCYYISEGV
uniref:Uncharacterized protein n=1 Tax=Anopheles arabiensis TaxID=7173 RepID=A0A182IGY3_ANOAR